MSEVRKTILVSVLISFFVGSVAGTTGGIVASQIVGGSLGERLAPYFPEKLRRIFVLPQKTENQQLVPVPSSVPSPPSSENEELSTIEVVRRVSPAVVSILISKEITARSTGPIFPEDIFKEFGLEILPEPSASPSQPQKRQVGGGTGFILRSDGLIVTNKHVAFDEEASYTVVTSDGKRYEAKVLARDPFIDLAILKITAQGLPIVKLGDSDKLQIGESVIAIGNALSEFSNTITRGVVSGIKRRVTAGGPGIGSEILEEAIQTDAAINPGNSGGPLVNLRGEVIGINTAVSQAGQNLGFAIPINQAKPALQSVVKTGRIVRPWIGVRYVLVNKELAQENKLPVDYGALVLRGERRVDLAVIPGSPADKAGLRENDIILEVDGIKITEDIPLAKQIQKRQPGDSVRLKVLSQGKTKVVPVVLEELKQ